MGGLEKIVDELYASFMKDGITASIYVVCGRNEKLKEKLDTKDWGALLTKKPKKRKRDRLAGLLKPGKKAEGDNVTTEAEAPNGDVKVVGLGFVTKMAEYMVSRDWIMSSTCLHWRFLICGHVFWARALIRLPQTSSYQKQVQVGF